MKFINVSERLPDYELPVFLKYPDGVYIGFRDYTDKEGEHYVILKKPTLSCLQEKAISWMPIEFPVV